jgi:primosomal protein N' (replication factor Y)
MVAKGHDFPKVTLVGMLSADQSLYLDDYRANERTFSMICQTVGRAGRADDKGNAIIQCYTPDHNVLRLAKEQDYPSFYDGEIRLREALKFPPFCDIAAFTVTSDDEANAFTAANSLFEYLKENALKSFANEYFNMFGPFEAPIYKLNEKYRMRMVVKCKLNALSRRLFHELLMEFAPMRDVTLAIDLNPLTV